MKLSEIIKYLKTKRTGTPWYLTRLTHIAKHYLEVRKELQSRINTNNSVMASSATENEESWWKEVRRETDLLKKLLAKMPAYGEDR